MAKRTGQYGAIYHIEGASAALTDEAMSQATNLPGDETQYAVKTLYKVTDRTKKILDPSVPVILKDGASVIKATNYKIYWGSGYVEFFVALTTGTTVTITGAFIATTASDLRKAVAVRNWQWTTTRGDVDAGDYDTGEFDEHVVASAAGTFQFEQISTGNTTMYNKFRRGKLIMLALYEDVSAPFYWVVFGTLREQQNGAPRTALNAGTVQGVLSKWPEPLLETL
jgi:hypothetical protein